MEGDGDNTTRHCGSSICSACHKFNHMRVRAATYEDNLYVDSFYGSEFKLILQISQMQFEHIIASIMNCQSLISIKI